MHLRSWKTQLLVTRPLYVLKAHNVLTKKENTVFLWINNTSKGIFWCISVSANRRMEKWRGKNSGYLTDFQTLSVSLDRKTCPGLRDILSLGRRSRTCADWSSTIPPAVHKGAALKDANNNDGSSVTMWADLPTVGVDEGCSERTNVLQRCVHISSS